MRTVYRSSVARHRACVWTTRSPAHPWMRVHAYVNASPLPAARSFTHGCALAQSTKRTRPHDAAVTAPDFQQYMQSVGISDGTLPYFYDKEDHGDVHTWVARSPRSFPIAVALSGGADSMSLMLLLREYLQLQHVATPLLAITVDHALRAESREEAEHVRAICRDKWNVTHVIARREWQSGAHSGPGQAIPRKSKMQEAARQYRYELLAQQCRRHGVKCLFVAHNLGDQLETTLFRLGRSSGIDGLAGISACTELRQSEIHQRGMKPDASETDEAVQLIRPLLDVSKTALKATCQRFGQDWVEDPSNDSLMYDRIRIRKELARVQLEWDQSHSDGDLKDAGGDIVSLVAAFQRAAVRARQDCRNAEQALLEKHILRCSVDSMVLSTAFLHDQECFDELVLRVLSFMVRKYGTKETPPRLASLQGLARDLRVLPSGKKLTLSGCCVRVAHLISCVCVRMVQTMLLERNDTDLLVHALLPRLPFALFHSQMTMKARRSELHFHQEYQS